MEKLNKSHTLFLKLSMKPGDLVRRNHRYKDHLRKDVAIVIEAGLDDPTGAVKLVWMSEPSPQFGYDWHPIELLEVINESR